MLPIRPAQISISIKGQRASLLSELQNWLRNNYQVNLFKTGIKEVELKEEKKESIHRNGENLSITFTATKTNNAKKQIEKLLKEIVSSSDSPLITTGLTTLNDFPPSTTFQLHNIMSSVGNLTATIKPLSDKQVDEPYSIESKTILVPNAAKKMYKTLWSALGDIPNGHYVLELASGAGSSLSFYSNNQIKKVIPTDCSREVSDQLIRRFPTIPIFIGADMFNFHKDGILPSNELKQRFKLTACIGTNGISYAKDESELSQLYKALDRDLVTNPLTGNKLIIHVLHGRYATEDKWGESHEEAKMNFIKANLKTLQELGYAAHFVDITAFDITKKEDLSPAQIELLNHGSVNQNVISKKDNSKVAIYYSLDVPEDHIREELEVSFLIANKKN